MSSFVRRVAVAALAAALGGGLLSGSPSAADSAAVVTSADSAAVVTSGSYGSGVSASVTFDEYVRRGGHVTYKVRVANRNYGGVAAALVAGDFPAGTRRVRVIGKPRGVSCEVRARKLDCEIDSLGEGDRVSLTVRAWLSPARRGKYVAKFGLNYAEGPGGHVWTRDRVRFAKFTTRIV
ncbi:hypothetical protein [Planomonospora venezuelensis]|uniref:DUF11 domain-containing protein n=1 Tax=Planomonospora venezuelensis TaxID=1999 RepID=A0A841D701_PLAVE|nr:hypothetical protein [Planomonospora venezuelensis]MBB5964128.1 hypothetical protein [Planomonospora venezuelensis]GIN01811.1 hypothetical protein Pve01_34690 [Planomonospora venezuelensis]